MFLNKNTALISFIGFLFVFIIGCAGKVETDGNVIFSDYTNVGIAGNDSGCPQDTTNLKSQEDTTFNDSAKEYIRHPELCGYPLYFEREIQASGIFLDPDFRPFETVVDSDDFWNYYFGFTAKDISEIAYYTTVAYKRMHFPNQESYYETIRNGHFVVVSDNENFNELYAVFGETGDSFGAFVNYAENVCYQTPENAVWSSVIRSDYWKLTGIHVIIHEMTHIASGVIYGDLDAEHSNKLLWLKFGEKTFMNEVIKIYEENHKIDLPQNNNLK